LRVAQLFDARTFANGGDSNRFVNLLRRAWAFSSG
jgi:hypothetical protein